MDDGRVQGNPRSVGIQVLLVSRAPSVIVIIVVIVFLFFVFQQHGLFIQPPPGLDLLVQVGEAEAQGKGTHASQDGNAVRHQRHLLRHICEGGDVPDHGGDRPAQLAAEHLGHGVHPPFHQREQLDGAVLHVLQLLFLPLLAGVVPLQPPLEFHKELVDELHFHVIVGHLRIVYAEVIYDGIDVDQHIDDRQALAHPLSREGEGFDEPPGLRRSGGRKPFVQGGELRQQAPLRVGQTGMLLRQLLELGVDPDRPALSVLQRGGILLLEPVVFFLGLLIPLLQFIDMSSVSTLCRQADFG